jgi:hypothetical protein
VFQTESSQHCTWFVEQPLVAAAGLWSVARFVSCWFAAVWSCLAKTKFACSSALHALRLPARLKASTPPLHACKEQEVSARRHTLLAPRSWFVSSPRALTQKLIKSNVAHGHHHHQHPKPTFARSALHGLLRCRAAPHLIGRQCRSL